jgi:hypothetical protein
MERVTAWATTTLPGIVVVSIGGSLVAAGLWSAGKAEWRRLVTPRIASARRRVAGEKYATRCIEAEAFGEPSDPLTALLYVSRVATTGLKSVAVGIGLVLLGMALSAASGQKTPSWSLLAPLAIMASGWGWLADGMQDVGCLQRLLNERTEALRAVAWRAFERKWAETGSAPDELVRRATAGDGQ